MNDSNWTKKVQCLESGSKNYYFETRLSHLYLRCRELCDVSQVDPQVKWGPPKYYLLKDFAKISIDIVLEHQVDSRYQHILFQA